MKEISRATVFIAVVLSLWAVLVGASQAKSIANNEIINLPQCDKLIVGASIQCGESSDLGGCITNAMKGADCFVSEEVVNTDGCNHLSGEQMFMCIDFRQQGASK